MRMRVRKYLPDKMFGFCQKDSHDVFFHLEDFRPCEPPPVLGEEVEVIFDPPKEQGKAPKASYVERLSTPPKLEGVVKTYDSSRGFGFAEGEDGVSYHVHQSEWLGANSPSTGTRIQFYAGKRQGRPRACHVSAI